MLLAIILAFHPRSLAEISRLYVRGFQPKSASPFLLVIGDHLNRLHPGVPPRKSSKSIPRSINTAAWGVFPAHKKEAFLYMSFPCYIKTLTTVNPSPKIKSCKYYYCKINIAKQAIRSFLCPGPCDEETQKSYMTLKRHNRAIIEPSVLGLCSGFLIFSSVNFFQSETEVTMTTPPGNSRNGGQSGKIGTLGIHNHHVIYYGGWRFCANTL